MIGQMLGTRFSRSESQLRYDLTRPAAISRRVRRGWLPGPNCFENCLASFRDFPGAKQPREGGWENFVPCQKAGRPYFLGQNWLNWLERSGSHLEPGPYLIASLSKPKPIDELILPSPAFTGNGERGDCRQASTGQKSGLCSEQRPKPAGQHTRHK